MQDPVEIRRRIERLIERVDRRDDYGQLLARGDVIRRLDEVGDPEAWRAELRRQARADRLGIRTGFGNGVVWALLANGGTPARADESRLYGKLLEAIVPPVVEHRHEPSVLLRDGTEVILRCDRCPALGYGDAADALLGGDLLEENCENEEPPALTALALVCMGREGPATT